MADTKDDDSRKRNQKRREGEPLIRDRDMEIEERMRRNQERLERTVMPEGLRGVRSGPTKFPAPRANFKVFKEWARRDLWHIEDWPVLLLRFRPVDVKAHCWPAGFEDSLNDIMEAASTSIKAGRLREWESPRNVLVWAREKGYPIPKKLEELVNRFHPKSEGRPQAGADDCRDVSAVCPDPLESLAMAGKPVEVKADRGSAASEPIAKRKAPDTFIAALIRLIAEISKRAAEKGMPFDVTSMPGTKADFRALAIEFDGKLIKAPSTFNDYLAGLVRFKQGAQETAFYRDLFPELFL